MRIPRDVLFGFCLVGCSSAATLPSGGPFGGSADDAGVTVGTMTDAGGTGSSASGILFIPADAGSGAGSSSTSASSSSFTRTGPPPTWTYLYDTYLSASSTTPTIGDCDGSCHAHTECSSASACYAWIGTGAQGPLANGGADALFTWDDGYMPEDGPISDPEAEADFTAWIAAGSLDN